MNVRTVAFMSLNEASLFARVVELNGFSAAALRLQMPKSTLSKKIRDLEKELGVTLLNRTTRRISLTESGSLYYKHCCIALERMSAAAREARDVQEEPGGELRIGGPASLTTDILVPMVVEFLATHPRFTACLQMSCAPSDLKNGDFDVLFSVRPFDKSMYAIRLVYDIKVGLFASPRYIKGHGMPADPKALKAHQTVGFRGQARQAEVVWRLRSGKQRAAVTLVTPPRFEANDPLPMRAALIAGLGIGMLPEPLAAEAEKLRQLVRVLPGWCGEPAELNALHMDGPIASRKIRTFLGFATRWLKRV